MDREHRALLISAVELIETTRDEILRLRNEIELARLTVDRSHDVLSRTSGRSIRR